MCSRPKGGRVSIWMAYSTLQIQLAYWSLLIVLSLVVLISRILDCDSNMSRIASVGLERRAVLSTPWIRKQIGLMCEADTNMAGLNFKSPRHLDYSLLVLMARFTFDYMARSSF